MMLFKLSVKNIKKSMKDYTIYFLTLILGVAIFYMFNSLDSQQAMLDVSKSTREIIQLMMSVLSGVSVFVSFILAFLVVYANNFLIRRRKKEFGIYMVLGMGKWQISRILLGESILIGLLSLGVGIVLGIFGSQIMSILVAKLFEADMNQYQFIFSKMACLKTLIYFGIMYIAVIMLNMIAVSKCKLIDLINAQRKGERVKLKSSVLSIIIFLLSIGMLAFAYYHVTVEATDMSQTKMLTMIGIGVVATFLFFWSLSGFLLRLVQTRKKWYRKDLNAFVMRQLNSKVNTMVCSMTIICLMLFITICVLSSGFSMNQSMNQQLKEMVTADVYMSNEKEEEAPLRTVSEKLEEYGWNMNWFQSGYVEVPVYELPEITMEYTMGAYLPELKQQFPMLLIDTRETILTISDYNRIAEIYGEEKYSLNPDEYLILANYDTMLKHRNSALKLGTTVTVNGNTYHPKYSECQEGYLRMASQKVNMGILVVPDKAMEGIEASRYDLVANYQADTKEEKEQMEEKLAALGETKYGQNVENMGASTLVLTKISLYESSVGLGAIVTFIAIYLGVIFLISSAAILALKELSESSENKPRYLILRKIGAEEKMINHALFAQIGFFFLLPLALACVHAIFGLQVANVILDSMGMSNVLMSIIVAAAVIVAIYGGYFLATYVGSKRIIRGRE